MPLTLIREDITKMNTDAIVNAAKHSLLGGGGVDGAIHKAAGEELLQECISLHGCETGQAKITKAYQLPCSYVIHTVGPIWKDDLHQEEELLKSCYQSSLELALEYQFKSIAFPLISTGIYQFPKELALRIATDTIERFLSTHDMDIYLVVFDSDSFSISSKLYQEVSQYIDDHYVEEHSIYRRSRSRYQEQELESVFLMEEELPTLPVATHSLDHLLTKLDDTFSERLLKLIDIRGKSDVEIYKRANIDRKLFSKIRSNKDYTPSKTTVLAFCFALELSLDETKDFLITAGFALSRSSKFDLIVEYLIQQGIYNIYEVNETLFAFDQNIIG